METNDKQDALDIPSGPVEEEPSSDGEGILIEDVASPDGEPDVEDVDDLQMVTILIEEESQEASPVPLVTSDVEAPELDDTEPEELPGEDVPEEVAETVAEPEEKADDTPEEDATKAIIESEEVFEEALTEPEAEAEEAEVEAAAGPETELQDATAVMPEPELTPESVSEAVDATSQHSTSEESATSVPEPASSKLAGLKGKVKPWMLGILVVAAVAIAVAVHFSNLAKRYDEATAEYDAGNFEVAAQMYQDLGNYKDSAERYQSATLWADARAAEHAAGTDPAKWVKAAEAYDAIGQSITASANAARCRDTSTYYEAMALLEGDGIQKAENINKAIELLEACNGVLDADAQIGRCQDGLVYLDAKKLMADAKWDQAAEAFDSIIESDFADVGSLRRECLDHAAYDAAEAELKAGHNYNAYKKFLSLASQMEEVAYDWLPNLKDRAEACKLPTPESGVVYRNNGYDDGCELTIDNSGNRSTYYKLYFGNELIITAFVSGDSSYTFLLPSGTYRMNKAYGDQWWGPDDMFGDEGTYFVCSFGGSEEVTLEYNNGYLISAGSGGTGIGTSYTDRGSF